MTGAAAVAASIVWTHGLAAVLRHLGPDEAALAAVPLTVAAILAALAGCVALPGSRAEGVSAVVGFLAALVIELNLPGSGAAALAVVPVSVVATAGARLIGSRLPASVDSIARFRPVVALAWMLLAMIAVVQIGRLATAMTDRQYGLFLTTDNPFWYKHECIGAYLYGAELSARGEENVYHASHYPGLDRDASPTSALEGVGLEDPFQYPPQFLLLPRATLALTGDVATIRVVWFALQVTLFAGAAVWLALWVGGARGRLALWLLPMVMASFPALHNFQFGQFHLPAVILAVAAMLLFTRNRSSWGGALLAWAILAKIFPLVLIPFLVVQRRFAAVAWTVGWGVAITAVALAVLGPAPFVAFFEYHLPRLSDGSAFAFEAAWPELGPLVVADNQGVFGLGRKLGLDAMTSSGLARAFGLAVLGLASFVALGRAGAARSWHAGAWLGALGLASLASPGAWGDYVPVTAVWLLSLVAVPIARTLLGTATFATAALFLCLSLGTMPLGRWEPMWLMIPMSAVGVLIMIVVSAGVLVAPGGADASQSSPFWNRTDRGTPALRDAA